MQTGDRACRPHVLTAHLIELLQCLDGGAGIRIARDQEGDECHPASVQTHFDDW